ncbi:MAG TPA: hypothetical protein DEF51_05255 [Myxococcales bacterium]|nr:hypothetical protein [Myxococcales bacterium]
MRYSRAMTQSVGRYALESQIAKGALGTLWRARARGDGGFSRPVAVRTLPSELANDRRFVGTWSAIASELIELGCPHVEQVLDLVIDDGTHFVTEWVEGLSVAEWMARHDGPVPWQLAVEIAIEALRGLAIAHHARLTHDGISPHAIRIARDGSIKLTRFGAAAALAASGAGRRAMESHGLRHPAPELVEGEGATPATDLFGVGCLLFEVIAGRPAHDAPAGPERDAQLARLAPDLSTLRPDAPPLLVATIERAMQVDPGARQLSAEALIDALSALARTEPELVGPETLGRSVRALLERPVDDPPHEVLHDAAGGPAALAASIRGMVSESKPKKPRGLSAQRTMHVDAEELSELIGDAGDGLEAQRLESNPPPASEADTAAPDEEEPASEEPGEDETPKRYTFERKGRSATAKASAQRGLKPVTSEAEPLPLTRKSRPQGLTPAKTEFLDEDQVDALTIAGAKKTAAQKQAAKPRGLSPAKTEFLDEDQVDSLKIDD